MMASNTTETVMQSYLEGLSTMIDAKDRPLTVTVTGSVSAGTQIDIELDQKVDLGGDLIKYHPETLQRASVLLQELNRGNSWVLMGSHLEHTISPVMPMFTANFTKILEVDWSLSKNKFF